MTGFSVGAVSAPQLSSAAATQTASGGGASADVPQQVQQSPAVTQFLLGQDGAKAGAAGGAVTAVSQLPPIAPSGVTQGGDGDTMTQLRSMLVSLAQLLTQLVAALEAQVAASKGGGVEQVGSAGTGCGMAGMSMPLSSTATKATTGGASTSTAQQSTTQTVSQAGKESNAFEQRVLELVNADRTKAGLAPLQYDATLDSAATGHNATQVATRTMAHKDLGDGDPGSRIRAVGWKGSWGENVAVGQKTPEQVHAELMNSPTHRANIMNPSYRYMGVAYGATADGHAFWTEEFGG